MFQLPARNIPEPSSSRSPEKGDSSSKRIQDMEREKNRCNEDVRRQRKKLKLRASFDSKYWTERRQITDKQVHGNDLTKQISIARMKDNSKAFLDSEEGQNLLVKETSLRLDIKLYEEQAQRMSSDDTKSKFRRASMEVFKGAETGLGIKTCRGERDSSRQLAFRADLGSKMGSDHPDPMRDLSWCPVTCTWWPTDCMRAGHLFSWRCGEESMEVIFGPSDSGQSELFTPENGILWSAGAKDRFEAGHFVIVPDVANEPTQQQVDAWDTSNPKEYKIRILDPKQSSMQRYIGTLVGKRWADLDNDRLQFRTPFRPRARYLYFAYCAAMLRRSFRGQHLQISKAELRKRFWGTPGRYMLEGMLMRFVEEMGHEYGHLLEGAIKEEADAVAEPTAVAAANAYIQETLKGDDSDSDSDSDSDEDNEEIEHEHEDEDDYEDNDEDENWKGGKHALVAKSTYAILPLYNFPGGV